MRNSFNFLQCILQTTLFSRTAIFLTKISTPFKTALNTMPWNSVFPHLKSHIWKSGRSNRHKSFNICTALEAFSNSEICLLLIFKQMKKDALKQMCLHHNLTFYLSLLSTHHQPGFSLYHLYSHLQKKPVFQNTGDLCYLWVHVQK